MVDIARLGFRVDSSEARTAKRDLDELTGSARRTDRAEDALAATTKRLALQLGGLVSAGAAVRTTFAASQEYRGLINTFKGMGRDGGQAAATLDSIAAIANRTRAPLGATAQLFQRVSVAQAELGASSAEVMKFTESVGLALASTGGGAASAEGALLQLSQAMAGGIVRAEEFNSILEGAYPIAMAAAKGIEAAGGSVGKLRKMVVDGEVTSAEFFQAIISQSDELAAAFARTTPTVGQALTVMRNNFTMFVGEMDGALGVTEMLAKGMLFMAENMDRVAIYAAAAGAAFAIRYVGGLVLAVAMTGSLSSALVTLRWALARTGIGLLIIGAGELVTQFMRLVRATGGFGNAMAAMGQVGNEVFDRMLLAADAMGRGFQSVAASMHATWLDTVAGMQEAWSNFAASVAGIAYSIPGMGDVGKALLEQAMAADRAVDKTRELADLRRVNAEAYRSQAGQLMHNATKELESLEALKKTLSEVNAEIEGGAGGGAGVDPEKGKGGKKSATAKLSEDAQRAKAIMEEVKRATFDALSPMQQYAQQVAEIEDLHARGFLNAKEFGLALNHLTNEVQNANIEPLKQQFESLTTTLINARRQGQNWKQALRDWVLDATITAGVKKLTEAFGELVDTMTRASTIKSKGGGGGLFGGLLGGLFGGFKGWFAEGGTLGAGQWGMAGENGPEPVVGPAKIISNQDAFSGGQAGKMVTELIVRHEPGMIVEMVRNEAGALIQQASPGIQASATKATLQRMQKTKSGWGG